MPESNAPMDSAVGKAETAEKLANGNRSEPAAVAILESDSRVERALREWRMFEVRRRRIPAFRIFSDRTLTAIAQQRPRTAQELLAISGVGIATVEKYGQQIYRLVE